MIFEYYVCLLYDVVAFPEQCCTESARPKKTRGNIISPQLVHVSYLISSNCMKVGNVANDKLPTS